MNEEIGRVGEYPNVSLECKRVIELIIAIYPRLQETITTNQDIKNFLLDIYGFSISLDEPPTVTYASILISLGDQEVLRYYLTLEHEGYISPEGLHAYGSRTQCVVTKQVYDAEAEKNFLFYLTMCSNVRNS